MRIVLLVVAYIALISVAVELALDFLHAPLSLEKLGEIALGAVLGSAVQYMVGRLNGGRR